jgi:hypothetical protein
VAKHQLSVIRAVVFVATFSGLSSFAQTTGQAAWVHSILGEPGLLKRERKAQVAHYNSSSLWTRPDNSMVFGFIGDDYQRLRVKILTATKQAGRKDLYIVTGKSMVKNVVRDFTGTMKLTHARVYKIIHDGIDEEYKNRGIKACGVIVGEYHFYERKEGTRAGAFDGVFATYWYVDRKGRIKYDDHEIGSDAYRNNQFAGTWTSYKDKVSKVANWGDYRIPLAGGLDIGAGEFSPENQYLRYGWQSHRDAYVENDKRARMEEERKWGQ